MTGKILSKQGEIWFVDLEPVVGHEANKVRSCVVLQNDAMNRVGYTYVVAPLLKTLLPVDFIVPVTKSELNGLDRDRVVDLSKM